LYIFYYIIIYLIIYLIILASPISVILSLGEESLKQGLGYRNPRRKALFPIVTFPFSYRGRWRGRTSETATDEVTLLQPLPRHNHLILVVPARGKWHEVPKGVLQTFFY
jgi:hypothetical protein